MKEYTLYFSFFGRYMKHTLTAKDESDAKEKVKNKVVFYNCHESLDQGIIDFLNGFKK